MVLILFSTDPAMIENQLKIPTNGHGYWLKIYSKTDYDCWYRDKKDISMVAPYRVSVHRNFTVLWPTVCVKASLGFSQRKNYSTKQWVVV